MVPTPLLTALFALPAAVWAAPAPSPLNLQIGAYTHSTGKHANEPKSFTSAFSVRATPDTIINNTGVAVPGQTGALGHYSFRINSKQEIICYDIRFVGVNGTYKSPAKTATHIHQAAKGAAGPPRIAFPNPKLVRTNHLGQEIREASGCLQGPFTTGLNTTSTSGIDTGSASGFKLSQIEANPDQFFADTHTADFAAGAIRGQLLRSELEVRSPKRFDAIITTTAVPGQVVNNSNVLVPGQEGARGAYKLKVNLKEDTLCYQVDLAGVTGQYFSPAKTATHVHQAVKGKAGPPRLALRNPKTVKHLINISIGGSNQEKRSSEACIKGPFTTGLTDAATGLDTGSASGFTLQKLVDDPSAFFADTHTEKFAAGAIRGQLTNKKQN